MRKTVISRMITIGLMGFAGYAGAATNCVREERVCVEPAETRMISVEGGSGGQEPVYQECWKWSSDFVCRDGPPEKPNECEQYEAKGCYEQSRTCTEYDSDRSGSTCVIWDRAMACEVAGTPTTPDTCNLRMACKDGQCYDTGYVADADFGETISLLEMAREMGRYMNRDTFTFFDGGHSTCREGYWGIKECCSDADAPLKSNRDVGQEMGMSAASSLVGSAANYAWDYASMNLSPYVFDTAAATTIGALGTQGIAQSTTSAIGTATGSALSPSFDFSFGYMGFGISTAMPGTIATQMGTTVLTQGVVGNTTIYLSFNPVMFGLAVGMMVYQAMAECEQEEKLTAVMKSNGLCTHIGDKTKKKFGIAKLTTKHYCCFNSRMARMIREAADAQGVKDMGNADSPHCEGLTIDQIKQIDFSKINMSEFIAQIDFSDAASKEMFQNRLKTRFNASKKFDTPYTLKNPETDVDHDGR